jgi:hypothetical protein
MSAELPSQPDKPAAPAPSPFSDFPAPASAAAKPSAPPPEATPGGSAPFSAERSPLVRFIKLCTLLLKISVGLMVLGFMLYYYLSIANPGALPKYDPKTGAGPTPFKTINQLLALPGQVLGKTKEVVATNDARVADLDRVVAQSENKDDKARARGPAYVPPTDPAPAPAEATAAAPRSALGQIAALPGQVVGQAKGAVEKNNARAGVLDGVIANPDGIEKGPAAGAARPTAAGAPAKPEPVATTSVTTQEAAEMAQSLVNFSLAQNSANAAAPAPAPAAPAIARPAASPPPAAPPPAKSAQPKKIQIGGGIVITSPGVPGTTEAGEFFITWVMNAKISGVFPGSPAKVMLNERLVRAGDTAQVRLKIKLEGLDLENRLILFRDESGATVSRSY